MSLEEALAKNTAALEANTAALLAAQGSAKTETKASATKTETKADTKAAASKTQKVKKVTKSEVAAQLTEVRTQIGVDAAKAIIKEVGGVDKMADIPEDAYEAVLAAAIAALNGDTEEAAEEDDGL